jgi:hypothetical protein
VNLGRIQKFGIAYNCCSSNRLGALRNIKKKLLGGTDGLLVREGL